MTLRSKLILGIAAALSILVAALYLISSVSLGRRFARLENKDTHDNVIRAVNAYNEELGSLALKVTDWSVWDDSYQFIEDNNEAFRKSNLDDQSFRNMQINLIVFVRATGGIRHAGAFDLAADQGRPVPGEFLKLLTPDCPLLQHAAGEGHNGVVLLPEGPMTVVAMPIFNSQRQGPIRGTLIFGRWLNEEGVRQLAEHTRLSLDMHRLDAAPLPPRLESARVALSGMPPSLPILVRPANDKTITGYTIINDIYLKPALLLHADIPRAIFAEGRASIRQLLLTLVVTSLCFGLVAHLLLEKLFLSRFAQRESEEHHRAVIAQTAEGILLKDPVTLRVLEANAAMQELLGYTASELLQLHTPDIFPADAASGLKPGTSELRCRRKDGSTVEVEMTTNRISYGVRTFGCFVVRDITVRKRAEADLKQTHRKLLESSRQAGMAEEALRELNEGLEKRVEERTRELENIHQQLLEISRQAGMAEVATSVLHNVGNVLNSVNVSCSVISAKVRKSHIGSVAKTSSLLHEHANDLAAFLTGDPTGRKLPDYLGKLAGRLAEEQEEVLRELELLAKNIDHIKDIVAMQQNYAKVSGLTEAIMLTDLVEDSLRMNEGSLTNHSVRLVREYSTLPQIAVEKHKALQILVNLIRNAKHACNNSGRADKQITVRVTAGQDCVQVSVIDNGVGIPPENLTRIFAHGFTTKPDGHGFGLHSGALAAREMGGSLTVHSDGPGTGATFTLELPTTSPTEIQNTP